MHLMTNVTTKWSIGMSEQYNTNLHIVSMCDILAKSTERAVSSRYVVLVRLHRWLQVFRQAARRLYI